MMKRYTLLLAGLALAATTSFAQTALYPDYGFQNCGRIRDALQPQSSDIVNTAFRLSNSRILLAGTSGTSDNGFAIGLARHLPNGNLDSSFGTNGKSAVRFTLRNTVEGATLQPDGKILIAGIQAPSNGGSQQIPCVTRFLSNGQPDTAWGVGGRQAFRFDPISSGMMVKAYPLGGGKTLALGFSSNNINGGQLGFGAARFTPDGEFDGTFSTNGMSRIPLTQGRGAMASVGGGPDSLYYSLFQTTANNIGYDLQVARYTKNGIDPTFRSNGIDSLTRAELGWPNTVANVLYAALQTDGKVLFLTHSANEVWHVTRLLKTGFRDSSFGTNGNVAIPVRTLRGFTSTPYGISVLDNGNILLSGSMNQSVAIRLMPNGALDAGFGDQGFHVLDLNNNAGNQTVVGYLPDGAGYLFYGTDFTGDASDFILARYIETPPVASILASDDSICPGDTIHLTVGGAHCASAIRWMRDSIQVGTGPMLDITIGGTYTAIADFGSVRDTSAGVVLWVSSLTLPAITQDRGLLTSTVTGPTYRYQWARNGTPIPGATGPTHLATIAGTYTVEIYDGPCAVSSLTVNVTVLAAKSTLSKNVTAVWEESSQAIRLVGETAGWAEACLIAMDGRRIPLHQNEAAKWSARVSVSSGIYRLKLISSSGSQTLGLPISR